MQEHYGKRSFHKIIDMKMNRNQPASSKMNFLFVNSWLEQMENVLPKHWKLINDLNFKAFYFWHLL